MARFRTQDIIVLVYFRSRGVQYRAIVDLILQTGSEVTRKEEGLIVKVSKITRKQWEEDGLAMCDTTYYTWNLQVTDQWPVDRITSCAKELAIADGRNETEAPLYYDRLKALTDVGPKKEEAVARYVSLQRELLALC